MRQRITFLLTCLLTMVMGAWADTAIPLSSGNYLDTSTSATTGTINNNDNGNLGSIHNGATATFTLTNATAQEMALTFLTATNNSGGNPQVTVTMNDGTEDFFTKTIDIENTKGWTPSTPHVFGLGTVPAGTITLKFAFSVSSDFVCNLGSIGLYNVNSLNAVPGDIDLAKGVYSGARYMDNGNVGYLSNGTFANYPYIYNTVNGTATLNIGMQHNGDGTLNVKIVDWNTGNVEVDKDLTITKDVCKGLTTPTAFELGDITKGAKSMKLTVSTSASFLIDYHALSLDVVNAASAWKDFEIDLRQAPIGDNKNNATEKYLTIDSENNYSYSDAADPYNARLVAAKYNGSQHGYENFKAYVPVEEGNYKITLGNCQYGTGTGYVKNADETAVLDIIDYAGHTVTSFNQAAAGNCYDQNTTDNVVTVYYQASQAETIAIVCGNYTPYIKVEKVSSVPVYIPQANISFSNDTEDVEGTVPATKVVNIGDSFTIPANRTLFKSGYTLTGWTDGTNNYSAGSVITPEGDMTLKAVFTQNTVELANTQHDVTVTWDFQTKNGAPTMALQGNSGILVAQATVNSKVIDVKLDIDATSGKCNNASWTDWAQVNAVTTFTMPSKSGASLQAHSMSEPINGNTNAKSTFDGTEYISYANSVAQYTTTNTSGESVLTVQGGGYYRTLTLTYPGSITPWSNFEDFALDLRNGNYIHSDETSNVTIGFKKDGDAFVRTTSDDDDAIGKITGKFHSNEHGVQNFSMTVGVPGYVKITAGTCAWGGNLTVTGTNGFSASVNTKTGACYHQNTEKNVVVLYYSVDEATTLTIAGGSYMPYIKVESVDKLPASHTVNFYNGNTLVEFRSVYDGLTLTTLPASPSIDEGQHFRGWFTSTDASGEKALTSTVITEDVDFYAYIMDITTKNGFIMVDANDAQSLLNAIEYCNENAGDDIQKIYVPNGTYDLGTLCRTEVGKNIVIIGESREGVLIQNHPTEPGIQATSTLRITGDNVYMQDLTLRCDVSYPGSATNGVGVALEINGDKLICNNVELQCNQDTYYSNGSEAQRGYFKGGRIEGTVDYVCGGGNMWFEGTQFYNNARTNKDVIFAPSTYANTQYGYVASNCTFDGASGQEGFNLARPWQGSPAVTFLNCTFKQLPSAKGYANMGSGLKIRFHEYNSQDADGNAITGHDLSACSPADGSDEIYLTDEQVAAYSYANVMGGNDSWDPEAIIALYSATIQPNIAGWASFTPAFDCVLEDGAQAYIVTAINHSGNTFQSLSAEKKNVLKAGEGYFVKCSSTDKYVASITPEDAEVTTGTMLVGCLENVVLSANSGSEPVNYFLGTKEGKAGLYYVASSAITIPAGKCYLQSNSNTFINGIEMTFEEDATGIGNISVDEEISRVPVKIATPNGIKIGNYNIAGQRVK